MAEDPTLIAKKHRMCDKKASFRSKARAEMCAANFGQRVYECPICFCWHCTSKENWQDEFVRVEDFKKYEDELRIEIRREFKNQIKKKNVQITDLLRQLAFEKKRNQDLLVDCMNGQFDEVEPISELEKNNDVKCL